MGQQQIYKILKANKNKWFTSKELAELTGTNYHNANRSLKKLYLHGEIHRKEIQLGKKFFYHYQFRN